MRLSSSRRLARSSLALALLTSCSLIAACATGEGASGNGPAGGGETGEETGASIEEVGVDGGTTETSTGDETGDAAIAETLAIEVARSGPMEEGKIKIARAMLRGAADNIIARIPVV